MAPSFVADVKILAEAAHQIAVGEKYRAGAVSADQGGFLAEMGVKGGDKRFFRSFADAGFAREAVNAAQARAEFAVCQDFPAIPDFLGKRAGCCGPNIGGLG